MAIKILLEQEAKDFIFSIRKNLKGVHKEHISTKGYYRVGKRNFTAFRINDNGILRLYENIDHEGDCRRRLKLKQL